MIGSDGGGIRGFRTRGEVLVGAGGGSENGGCLWYIPRIAPVIATPAAENAAIVVADTSSLTIATIIAAITATTATVGQLILLGMTAIPPFEQLLCELSRYSIFFQLIGSLTGFPESEIYTKMARMNRRQQLKLAIFDSSESVIMTHGIELTFAPADDHTRTLRQGISGSPTTSANETY